MESSLEPPFFVYGTLRAGQSNAHLLRGAIRRNRPAILRGAQMWDLGRYPMIIESDEGEIAGELIEIEAAQYASVLKSLDRLEGVDGAAPENPAALYRRLRRAVEIEGERVEAWVYFGARELGAARAPGEKWRLVAAFRWRLRRRKRVTSAPIGRAQTGKSGAPAPPPTLRPFVRAAPRRAAQRPSAKRLCCSSGSLFRSKSSP